MNIHEPIRQIQKTTEAEKMRGTVFENPRLEVSLPLEGEGEGTPAGAVVTVKKPSFAVREWLLSSEFSGSFMSGEGGSGEEIEVDVIEEGVEFVLPFGEDGVGPLVHFMQVLLKVARGDEERIWVKLGGFEGKETI